MFNVALVNPRLPLVDDRIKCALHRAYRLHFLLIEKRDANTRSSKVVIIEQEMDDIGHTGKMTFSSSALPQSHRVVSGKTLKDVP